MIFDHWEVIYKSNPLIIENMISFADILREFNPIVKSATSVFRSQERGTEVLRGERVRVRSIIS